MNSWKVILATMVIFGAGVITGGLVVHHAVGPQRARQARVLGGGTNATPQTVTPAQMQRMEFLIRANLELDLTPDQRERIEKILREGQEKSRKIWEAVQPDMRKELQLVRERIKAELSPEQRRRFEELMKKSSRPIRPEEQPMRDRPRLQNPPDRFPDGAPRPLRRENPLPLGNPPPGVAESLPPVDTAPPTNAEPR